MVSDVSGVPADFNFIALLELGQHSASPIHPLFPSSILNTPLHLSLHLTAQSHAFFEEHTQVTLSQSKLGLSVSP